MDESCDPDNSNNPDNSLTIGLSIAGTLLFLLLIAFGIWIVNRRLKQLVGRIPNEENPIDTLVNEGSCGAALVNSYATPPVADDRKKKAFDRKMAQFDELKDLPRFEKDQIHVGKILGKFI